MRLAAVTIFAIQGLAIATLAGQPSNADGPPLVPSRQNVFTIPFSVTPPRTPAEMPREAVLYVSHDRGASMQEASRVDPRQQHFKFRAEEDGEYWFTVKTIDHTGQMVPTKHSGPDLRVLVDTKPPELHVEARRLANSAVEVQWDASDDNIDAASLKVEYQAAGDARWIPVQIDSSRIVNDGSTINGSAIVTPDVVANVTVQVEISDRADNRAVSKRIIPVAAADDASPMSAVGPRYSPPPITPPIGQQVQTPYPQAPNQPAPQWQPDGSRVWPPDQITYAPLSQGGAAQTQPLPSQINPPVTNDVSAQQASIPTKQVNSSTFELAYDLGAMSPDQVARVDFWGTSDRGQTWTHYGSDDDRRSPFPLAVPAYGRYGFRIAVQPIGSPGQPPPRPGDPPHMWIDVMAPNGAPF
jgi:hypothetical protein